MKTYVEFCSNEFPRYEDEDGFVNPDIFGKRLAEFLHRQLNNNGIKAEEPFAEDWGWVIPIPNERFRTWIGCGNYTEYPNGFLCFIEPHTPIIRRFFVKKIDTTKFIESIYNILDVSLKNCQGVSNIKWWTHKEFNNRTSGNEK